MLNIVHLFDESIDSRSLVQVAEGLLNRPDIKATLSDELNVLGQVLGEGSPDLARAIQEADFIFRPNDAHFHRPKLDEMLNGYWHKVIYYDIKDDTAIDTHRLGNCRAYLKRSWLPTMAGIIPFPYSALDCYYLDEQPERDIDVVYLFSPRTKDGVNEGGRYRVYEALADVDFDSAIIGATTHKRLNGRRLIFEPSENNPFVEYLKLLKRAKIVVTCGPDHPGGDSRLWEALASGACVVTDRPRNNARLLHAVHCAIYDTGEDGIKQMIREVTALLHHDEIRQHIAYTGYEYVKEYHSAEARIGQVLDEL